MQSQEQIGSKVIVLRYTNLQIQIQYNTKTEFIKIQLRDFQKIYTGYIKQQLQINRFIYAILNEQEIRRTKTRRQSIFRYEQSLNLEQYQIKNNGRFKLNKCIQKQRYVLSYYMSNGKINDDRKNSKIHLLAFDEFQKQQQKQKQYSKNLEYDIHLLLKNYSSLRQFINRLKNKLVKSSQFKYVINWDKSSQFKYVINWHKSSQFKYVINWHRKINTNKIREQFQYKQIIKQQINQCMIWNSFQLNHIISSSQFQLLFGLFRYQHFKKKQQYYSSDDKGSRKQYLQFINKCQKSGDLRVQQILYGLLDLIQYHRQQQQYNEEWEQFIKQQLKQFLTIIKNQVPKQELLNIRNKFNKPEIFVRIFIFLYTRSYLYQQLNQLLASSQNFIAPYLLVITRKGIKALLGNLAADDDKIQQDLYRGINQQSNLMVHKQYYWNSFTSFSQEQEQTYRFRIPENQQQRGQMFILRLLRKQEQSQIWYIRLNYKLWKPFVYRKQEKQVLILPGFPFYVQKKSDRLIGNVTEIITNIRQVNERVDNL